MNGTDENIKAKFQKLKDEKELEKISGGRKIYGVSLDLLSYSDEFIGYLNNPNGYSLDKDKWVLIDENNYTVIGSYDSIDEMNKAVDEIKTTDADVEFQFWHVLGEYGLLEHILIEKGLRGHHH